MSEAPPSVKSVPSVASFHDLLLTIVTNFYLDIHYNLSGICFFGFLAWGVFDAAHSDQAKSLMGYAGTYLFSSGKRAR